MNQKQPVCKRCTKERSPNEAMTYGSFCEDCWAFGTLIRPGDTLGSAMNLLRMVGKRGKHFHKVGGVRVEV